LLGGECSDRVCNSSCLLLLRWILVPLCNRIRVLDQQWTVIISSCERRRAHRKLKAVLIVSGPGQVYCTTIEYQTSLHSLHAGTKMACF
jgi:hypothetical protein